MKAAPPSKKQTLLQFLERGVAMVHLDARRPGVLVPKQFEGEAHLRLNLSYRYSILDLIVDESHVQATLSFSGRPFQCQMPWSCIFGITSNASGGGQVWPEDLPTEVMQTMASPPDAERPTPVAPRGGKPALVPVDGGAEGAESADSAERTQETPRHLRLVR